VNNQIHTLPNLGFLLSDLPESLFDKLLEEAKYAEKSGEELVCGLTEGRKHVPSQYTIRDELNSELNEVILSFAYDYCDIHRYPLSHPLGRKPLKLTNLNNWINVQRQNEYVGNHVHDGIISYTIWLKIPEVDQKDQASFWFNYSNTVGNVMHHEIKLNQDYVGKIIIFPSLLEHTVYPFYNSAETRFSVSGNVAYDVGGNAV
jgi:hypothetical protein